MINLMVQIYIKDADAYTPVEEVADAIMEELGAMFEGEAIPPVVISADITALGNQYPMGSDVIASRIWKDEEIPEGIKRREAEE